MANKIYSSTERAHAHEALEKAIQVHPNAECREDQNSEEPYQVWDGPEIREVAPAPARAEASLDGLNIRFTPSEMDDLATRIAAKLKGEG